MTHEALSEYLKAEAIYQAEKFQNFQLSNVLLQASESIELLISYRKEDSVCNN